MIKPTHPEQPEQPDTTPPLKRGQSAQVQRDLRSKAALKTNMARRKAQARAREAQDADQNSPELGQQE